MISKLQDNITNLSIFGLTTSTLVVGASRIFDLANYVTAIGTLFATIIGVISGSCLLYKTIRDLRSNKKTND